MSVRSRPWLAGAAAFGLWAATAAAPALAADPKGVSSDLTLAESTTDQEKLAYAAAAVQEIGDAERQIEKMLVQLRAKKADAENVECVVRALTLVKALKQVATTGETNLKVAVNEGNEEKAAHEWRKVGVALEKTRQLFAEAQRCSSSNDLESGTTLVDWANVEEFVDQFLEADIDDFDIDVAPPSITPFQ
jgi:hypothetical protein